MQLDDNFFADLEKLTSRPADVQESKEPEKSVEVPPTGNGDMDDFFSDLEKSTLPMDQVKVPEDNNHGEETEEEPTEETSEDKPSLKVCGHTCKCGKFWSHMISPDDCVANNYTDSTCPDCVANDTKPRGTDQEALNWEVEVNNSEIARCANMNQAQLIEHIRHLQKHIHELRIRQQRSRHLLAEKMSKDFTDEERADFRKALKKVEKTQKKAVKKEKVAGNQKEKAIKSLMNALGISREKAEKMVEAD